MPFYHFTDPRNLPSIRKYGLLSWQQLIQRKIQHVPSSSDLSRQLDERKGLQNYVRLCLRRWHPMAALALSKSRVQSLIWLEIDEAVATWRATKFSDRNATDNDAIVNHDPKTALESDDVQAEILIERSLGTRWITFPTIPAPGTKWTDLVQNSLKL